MVLTGRGGSVQQSMAAVVKTANPQRSIISKSGSLLPASFLALGLLVLPLAATAHHSHAGFSGEPVEIEGELGSVIWRNPHPVMTLKVTDTTGAEHLWRIQVLGNVNGLNRNGVSGDLFQAGERVSITGQVSTYRDDLLLGTLAIVADGSVVKLGPEPSFGSVTYGGSGAAADTELVVPDGAPSLFRVWTVLDRTRNTDLPLRDAARSAKAAWDPVLDDYQRNCSPLGMPGAMMSPHPIEFVEQGDDITLRLEEWDGKRTIRVSEERNSVQRSASPMGNSVGRWDGSTLVVTTSGINFPYLDEYGTPQSDSVEILERFTLSEDGRYLDWSATVTDPKNLTEPVVISTTRWEGLAGETLQAYDCAATDDLLDK
jgi:hypothetical protein